MTCPDKAQEADFQKLVKLLGDSAPAAYRMWKYYEQSNPGFGAKDALSAFNRPTSEKKRAVQEATRNLRLDKESHVYHWEGDSPSERTGIKSLSAALDDIPEIAHRKTESEELFSDSGTNVHDLFKEIVLISDPASPALKTLVEKYGLEASHLDQLFKLKEQLSELGELLPEQMVYLENSAEGVPIAGTSDIIVYAKDSGKKYIVDLKTVYHTEKTKRDGIKDIWKGNKSYDRKMKRYASQVVAYGRMTEWLDRQAVTDHFIVPIEIELNDPKDLSKGYKSFKVREMESVREKGYMDYATRTIDLIFGDNSYAPSVKSIIGNDDSSKVYENLTGDFGSVSATPESLAKMVKPVTRNGVQGYFAGPGGEFRPFKPEALYDRDAQIRQIMDEYTSKSMRVNADMSYSIKNYLETGEESHLRMLGADIQRMKTVLQPFSGRTDLKVMNLHEIDGFKDKKNWILIEEGKNTHLFYIGTENLNTRFNTGLGNKSVFGKLRDWLYLTTKISSSLENTLGDARKLEGTLIAIKLKEANPEIRFGTTMVYGLGGDMFAGMIDLKENFETLRQISKDPVIAEQVLTPHMMQIIGDKKLLDYKNYRTDFLDMLSQYIKSRYPGNSDEKYMLKQLTDYAHDASKRKEMFDLLAEEINKRTLLGRDANIDYETYLLSAFYTQLQGIDISLLPNHVYRTNIAPTQNILNPMLQKLNVKLQNAVNKMSRSFWGEYKNEYNDALEKFLKTRGVTEKVSDRLHGNTPRHYAELYKHKTVKVTTKSGETIERKVPIFEFHDEGSADFNALPEAAQNLIRVTNDMIQKFAKQNDIKWKRGNLPLVRASMANRFFNVGGAKAYKDLVNTMLVDLEENFGVGDGETPRSGRNIFYSQEINGFTDPRHEMMGLMTDDHLNEDAYHKWSTNLESMMDVFAIQGLRYSVFNEVGTALRAVNSIFKWHKSNLLVDRLGSNIEWTEYVNTVNLENRDIDSGTGLNRTTRLVSRLASFGLYAVNPLTAASTYLGNEFTLWSESIANLISGSNRFKPGTKTKAIGIFTSAYGKKAINVEEALKIDLLMQRFRLFNEDISSLLNGYHRKGDKWLFRSKHMFSMLNAADYTTRAQIMIAQLLEDGSWDAFTVKDGKLEYDEAKDKRFNGQGKYTKEQSQALRTAMLAAMGQEPHEKLSFGYDDASGNSIRAYANYLLGSTDRETRSLANFKWWGKLFLGSKSWLPAKLDRWILAAGSNYREESALIGEYVFDTDENGNTVAFWKGEQMEGIIMSWLAAIDNLRRAKDQRKPLTQLQKNNITRSIGDFAIAAAAIAIASAIGDDDDETKRDDMMSLVLRRGADDLLSLYTVITLDEFLWTPIALSWAHNLGSRVFQGITDVDPEVLLRSVPVAGQLEKFYEFTSDSEFELTEK